MDPDEPLQTRRATDGLNWPPASRGALESPETGEAGPVRAPNKSRSSIWGIAAVALFAALAGGLVAGSTVAFFAQDDGDGAPPAEALSVATPSSLTVEQTSAIADVAARARPGVVKIESTRKVQGGTEQDVGSGVIIDGEGHIVTNAHVVVGTETLKVILADGSERSAILIGHDAPFTDVAVLQIAPEKLTIIETGDSSKLALGETVVAIGNPLAEFDGSVSVGVVSGLNRRRVFDGVRQDDLIQTDAALNNGNSGGALLNLRGQLIGMPTAVLRQNRSSQAVEGIGFALPSNRVIEVATKIIAAGGAIARPSLGLDHVDIGSEVISRSTRLTVDQGALVTAVASAGPSAAAGIQSGDVITKLGTDAVDREHPLLNVLLKSEPGQTVKVVLNRAGRIIEVEVRLGRRS